MDLRKVILSLFLWKMIRLIKLIMDPLVFHLFIFFDQIYEYIDNVLSKVQYASRKSFSTQYSLIAMIQKKRKNLDQYKSWAALLIDIIKPLIELRTTFLQLN